VVSWDVAGGVVDGNWSCRRGGSRRPDLAGSRKLHKVVASQSSATRNKLTSCKAYRYERISVSHQQASNHHHNRQLPHVISPSSLSRYCQLYQSKRNKNQTNKKNNLHQQDHGLRRSSRPPSRRPQRASRNTSPRLIHLDRQPTMQPLRMPGQI